MTEGALEEVGRLLSRRVGLRLDPAIRGRLARAVRDEAERTGEDEHQYVARLSADADLLQSLLNRVTVQETSFFRDPGQFDALASEVLPALRARGAPVHVWSAGCANGQEPYSLAMALAESGIADWHVLASDLSTNALARTRAPRYRERELRGLSPERRRRHLAQVGRDEWEIVAPLRERVTTIRHNLAEDAPPFAPGACQIVFCRNVLIYFGHDDVVAFLDRLAARLTDDSVLFVGYSESLWQVTDHFQLTPIGKAFSYRKTRPGASAHHAPAPTRLLPQSSAPPPAPPVPPPVRRPEPVAEPVLETVPSLGPADLMAIGEAALDRGDHSEAVNAFRKAAFLDPDHPLAHLNLGLALEVAGDAGAARRAFSAARAALGRCDTAEVEAALEGYRLDDLVRLLDLKAGVA